MHVVQLRDYIKIMTSSPEIQDIIANVITVATENSVNPALKPNELSLLNQVIEWIIVECLRGKDWPHTKGKKNLPIPLEDISSMEDLRLKLAIAEAENDGPFELPELPEYYHLITKFPDGTSVFRVTVNEACRYELMKLRSFIVFRGDFQDDDLETGRRSLWTIRDSDNNVLACIGLNRFAICSVSGINGVTPDETIIRDYVDPLIKKYDLKAIVPLAVPHRVMDGSGKFHDLYNLPDGLEVFGDLFLKDHYPKLSRLPDDMKVHGRLLISRNNNLKSTPNNLVATEGMIFSRCRNLTKISDGNKTVTAPASFEGSPIEVIGENCSFPHGIFGVSDKVARLVRPKNLTTLLSDLLKINLNRPKRFNWVADQDKRSNESYERYVRLQNYMDGELENRYFPGYEKKRT